MNTPLKIAAICALLAPVSAFAQDVDPGAAITPEETVEVIEVTDEMLESFRIAITDAGCIVVNDDQAAVVETATGYDEATLEVIVEKLRVYEEIVDASTDGGIALVTGACAN